MIASEPQTVESYLKKREDELKNDPRLEFVKMARSAYESNITVILRAGKSTNEDKKASAEVQQAMSNISIAFAKIAEGNANAEMENVQYVPESGDRPTKVNVEYLSKSKILGGTRPGTGADTGTTGWKEIYDKGLHEKGKGVDHWVQMHIVSQAFGGQGKPFNLVAAPNSINSGAYKKLETSIKTLLASNGDGNVQNVLWMEVDVTYYGGDNAMFAQQLDGKAGVYAYRGDGQNKWVKISNVLTSTSVRLPLPENIQSGKIDLNASSGTALNKELPKILTGYGLNAGQINKLIDVIKYCRIYSSEANFVNSIYAESQLRKLTFINREILFEVATNENVII